MELIMHVLKMARNINILKATFDILFTFKCLDCSSTFKLLSRKIILTTLNKFITKYFRFPKKKKKKTILGKTF